MKYLIIILFPFLIQAQGFTTLGVIMGDNASFTPQDIPSNVLTAWYDASDLTTITFDQFTPGSDSVEKWDDKSASGFDLTQGTGNQQPTYIYSSQNGLNVMSFDGTLDNMANTSFSFPDSWTCFIAYKDRTGDNGSMIADAAGKLLIRNTAIFQNSDAGAVTLSAELNDINIVVMEFDYTNDVYKVYDGDGSSIGTDNTSCANTLTSLTVGRNFPFTEYFNGKLCEIIFLTGAVYSTYGSDVLNYLNGKWAF